MKKVAILLSVSMFLLASWSPATTAETSQGAFQVAHALEDQLIAVYETVAPAVVSITAQSYTYDCNVRIMQPELKGRASGFVYDQDGHIVTNYHVIEGADAVSVTTADGRTYQARVVGADPVNDLAVLDIKADGLPVPVALADSDQLRVGQFVVAIGSPFGLDQTLSTGVISALGRVLASPVENHVIRDVIQTDAAIYPGSSGGPLLDLRGHLIGVNSQIAGPSHVPIGFGFAVSSNTVRRVVDEIISDPTVAPRRVSMLSHPYPADGYRKLRALAASHNIDLQVFDGDNRDAFFAAVGDADSGAAIYATATAYKDDLEQMSCFVKRGGRALLVYNDMWQVQNAGLEALFGVTVATETVKRVSHDGVLELDERMLPSYMAGMQVTAYLSGLQTGTSSSEGTTVGDMTLSAYLTADVEGGERGHLTSVANGQERLAYLAHPSAAVTFWPIGSAFPNSSWARLGASTATLASRSSSFSLKKRPSATLTSRTDGKSGVVPRIVTPSRLTSSNFTV